jgi:hypothetical protein
MVVKCPDELRANFQEILRIGYHLNDADVMMIGAWLTILKIKKDLAFIHIIILPTLSNLSANFCP